MPNFLPLGHSVGAPQRYSVPAELNERAKQVCTVNRTKIGRQVLAYLVAYLLKVSHTQHKDEPMIVRNRSPSTQVIEANWFKGSYGKRLPVVAIMYQIEKQKSSLRMFPCGKDTEGAQTAPGEVFAWIMYTHWPAYNEGSTWVTVLGDKECQRCERMNVKVADIMPFHLTIRCVFKVRATFPLT